MILSGLKKRLNLMKLWYHEDSDMGYFIEADVQYLWKMHELDNDLPFIP